VGTLVDSGGELRRVIAESLGADVVLYSRSK
jgi:hypothetical protein